MRLDNRSPVKAFNLKSLTESNLSTFERQSDPRGGAAQKGLDVIQERDSQVSATPKKIKTNIVEQSPELAVQEVSLKLQKSTLPKNNQVHINHHYKTQDSRSSDLKEMLNTN